MQLTYILINGKAKTLGVYVLTAYLTVVPSSFSVCVPVVTISTVLQKIDLIICLGGDGTLLYTSSLFTVH